MDSAREDLMKKLNNENIVEQHKIKRKDLKTLLKTNQSKEKEKYIQAYEDECMGLFKNIQNSILATSEKRDQLRAIQTDIKTELTNYNRNLAMLNSTLNGSLRKQVGSIAKQADIAVYLSSQQNLRNSASREKFEVIQNIEMLQIEYKNRYTELIQVEESLEELRKSFRTTRASLISHYLSVLKDGTDTKREGLYTIVQSLISLGIDPKPSMFPKVLDQLSIECIITLAKKSIELNRLTEYFNNIKAGKSVNFSINRSIHERIASVTKTNKVKNMEILEKKNK